jgi:hypothetical protein
MKIRAGNEISYDCSQPTPMILTPSVHPSCFSDLQIPDLVRLDPPIPANTYHNGFGNFCHVICAPAGRLYAQLLAVIGRGNPRPANLHSAEGDTVARNLHALIVNDAKFHAEERPPLLGGERHLVLGRSPTWRA